MSFFDEGDQPRRPQPRRPAGGVVSPPDPQTARVRQGVAAGVALLVIILLVVGVKGCLNNQKKRSLREYNRNVASLVQESDDQVGKPFFQQLAGGQSAGGQSINLETQVNQLRVDAEQLVARAQKLDVPGDMRPAQTALLEVLEFRRDALSKIAQKLPDVGASGTTADTAVAQITGQMLAFLASDVIYSQRVIPNIKNALDQSGIGGQTIPTSQFLPNLSWLDESQVATRLGASLSQTPTKNGPIAPGAHGHALVSTTVNGQDISPDTANRIPAGSNIVFNVSFMNEGDNDEQNVIVKVSIEGSGKPVVATTTVPQTTKGNSTTVDVPLRQAPPIGVPVQINVSIAPVAGEKSIDNNKRTYPAIFTK